MSSLKYINFYEAEPFDQKGAYGILEKSLRSRVMFFLQIYYLCVSVCVPEDNAVSLAFPVYLYVICVTDALPMEPPC